MDRTQNLEEFFEPLLLATLEVYVTIVRELLPTPAKTHYTFNLRDLSKVFQGMLMVDPETLSVRVLELIIFVNPLFSAYIQEERFNT